MLANQYLTAKIKAFLSKLDFLRARAALAEQTFTAFEVSEGILGVAFASFTRRIFTLIGFLAAYSGPALLVSQTVFAGAQQ